MPKIIAAVKKYLTPKPLGIILYKEKIVNHRSLLKVLLNPYLRVVGFCIGSAFTETPNGLGGEFINYMVIHDKVSLNLPGNIYRSIFTCNIYDKVLNERRIF